VIILTGKELFGQFRIGDFYTAYGMNEHWVRRLFTEMDLQALGEFTQGLYLDMKPAHEVRQDKRTKMAERKKAKEESGRRR
jgi:hypothetical protein